MASAQQFSANRANAKLSTGPADTARTRFNSLSHGMTSRQIVIPGEVQAEYDEFEAGLVKQLAPGSGTEKLLADRIVAAAWRLRRFTRMEAAFFTNRIEAYIKANPEQDSNAALANLFCDPAEASKMRLFLRYQTTVQREYDTACRMLEKARKERAHQEFVMAARAQAEARRAEAVESDTPAPRNGFASQPPSLAAFASMIQPPIRPQSPRSPAGRP
jgi:hypothetical protein